MSDTTLGQAVREKRLSLKVSLRQVAEEVEVSPTYLSFLENDTLKTPPTTERIYQLADYFEVNPDEWLALAGRLADDLPDIIHREPVAMPELLRAVNGLSADEIEKLRRQAERLKKNSK